MRTAGATLRGVIAVIVIVTLKGQPLDAQSTPTGVIVRDVAALDHVSARRLDRVVDLGQLNLIGQSHAAFPGAVHRFIQFSRDAGADAVARVDAVQRTPPRPWVGGGRGR